MLTLMTSIKDPAYSPARAVAGRVLAHLAQQLALARARAETGLAALPDEFAIETVIDAAFWASLRREEGYTPRISLALVRPEDVERPLTFSPRVALAAEALAKLAPAVERPGIHLGVAQYGEALEVWGTTRALPGLSFVLEVVAPGLLVVKYPHGLSGKFINVAVLEGDQAKVVDEDTALHGFEAPAAWGHSANVFVRLAVSMRAHGRGGSLLVVPAGSDYWRKSIVQPIRYSVAPPFSQIAELMRHEPAKRDGELWQEALTQAVDAIAGLTAVDGATVMNDQYEVLAFAVKIARLENNARVQEVMISEPVQGMTASPMDLSQLGGTRHLSAAQFVHDQRNAFALVASQDGRFTIFKWSGREERVHAHRVEALLL
jgi:hypothetical protein